MSKRRDTLALYEVIDGRSRRLRAGDSAAPVEATPAPLPPEIADASLAHAAPVAGGRTIRLPVGYLFVAAGATILLVIVAYSVGVSRGRVAGRTEVASQLPAINDPTAGPESLPAGSISSPTPGVDRESSVPNVQRSSTAPRRSAGAPAIDEDTRIEGLNYIVVERFSENEAFLVADFLAANGVDVMVLPDNNPALRRVVTRRGFEGWASNREAREFEQKIRRLGERWKQQGGSKDFSKLLVQKH